MEKTRKKIAIVTGAIMMFTSITSICAKEATPTTSSILVNGTEVKVNAYNIDGNNYFKLRDIAYMLNGTTKQFEVGYDSVLNSIVLTSEKSYTIMGGELEQGGNQVVETSATSSKIIKDGIEMEMSAYNINDNNYFKVRDIGETFDFGVDYDEKTNSVNVNTDKSYNERAETDDEGYGTNLFKPNNATPPPRPTPEPKPGGFTSGK